MESVTNESKALKALQIIAGLQPAWAWWKLFCRDDPPKYDQRDANSFAHLHHYPNRHTNLHFHLDTHVDGNRH